MNKINKSHGHKPHKTTTEASGKKHSASTADSKKSSKGTKPMTKQERSWDNTTKTANKLNEVNLKQRNSEQSSGSGDQW